MHRFCKSLIHHYQHILITMIDKFGIEYSEDGTTLKRCPKDFKGTFQIPNSVTSIEISAFEGCTGLTSIEIPNSVTSIEYGAFKGCTSLTSIKIPNSVTIIGYRAFSGCTGLTSIMIDTENSSFCFVDGILFNKDLTAIFCFPAGRQEQTYKIPDSVTSIESSAFEGCTGLTSIEIPNSVTSIERSAFSGCTRLTSIEIPNSVTSIEDFAFSGCTGLTSIQIPNSVTSIEWGTFDGCTGLTSIEIPNSVIKLELYSFKGCRSLRSISIPATVVEIDKYFVSNVGPQLEINVAEDNPNYCSKDGSLYTKDMSQLIHYCEHDLQTCVLPEGIVRIAPLAFEWTHIAQITLPESLKEIANDAFCRSENTKLHIPSGIQKIGNMAFKNSAMTELHIHSEHPEQIEVAENAFEDCAEHCTLYVPVGTDYAYRHHPVFGKFREVVTERVSSI